MVTKKKARKTKPHGIFQGRAPNTKKEEKIASLQAKITTLQKKLEACGTKQTRTHKKKCKSKKR